MKQLKKALEEYDSYKAGMDQGLREGSQNMLRELVAKKIIQGIPIEEIADMLEISIPKVCLFIEEIYSVGDE